eukprot:7070828-Heterocapsa_arctica.AAC.1
MASTPVHRSSLACLWDVCNAFPSLSHASLDLAVDEGLGGQDAALAKDRHRSSLVMLKDQQKEMICVAPGQGNRQGDGPAPQ